jgi:hypothetical protein
MHKGKQAKMKKLFLLLLMVPTLAVADPRSSETVMFHETKTRSLVWAALYHDGFGHIERVDLIMPLGHKFYLEMEPGTTEPAMERLIQDFIDNHPGL